MDLRIFIYVLLSFSVIGYLIPVENSKKHKDSKDIPLVIFENPVMYTLTNKSISKVINASYAIRYRLRDELLKADITFRNEDNRDFLFDKLKADLIIKRDNEYELKNKVEYTRDYFVSLDTEELFYDDIKKTIYNTKVFEGTYYKNYVKGDSLYLDINKKILTSKNTHFEININKKEVKQ